jgi:hypothetical protein
MLRGAEFFRQWFIRQKICHITVVDNTGNAIIYASCSKTTYVHLQPTGFPTKKKFNVYCLLSHFFLRAPNFVESVLQSLPPGNTVEQPFLPTRLRN